MIPTCLTVAAILSVVACSKYKTETPGHPPVSTTDASLSSDIFKHKHLSDDWLEDYDDTDDDASDDAIDDDDYELQSDDYPPLPNDDHNSGYLSSKKVDKFWSAYRQSHSARVIGGGNEDAKSLEEVKRHHERVKGGTACKLPQPRVIQVAELHPVTGKTYLPSCTVLHQCSESTGCCQPSYTCTPKLTERVELHFYAIFEVRGFGARPRKKTLKVEKLTFFNHTECECNLRSDEMPRDVLPTPNPLTESPNAHSTCRCPSPFSVRSTNSGSCACDCFDKQRDCIKYKKGKDYLNHEDRLCIEISKCVPPTCDYGPYARRSGRCPRRDERYRF